MSYYPDSRHCSARSVRPLCANRRCCPSAFSVEGEWLFAPSTGLHAVEGWSETSPPLVSHWPRALPRFRSCPVALGAGLSDRPVRIIVGFTAGGNFDLTARLIGQWLSQRLGQQFVVENRPGAGSNIATEAVVRAPADGTRCCSAVRLTQSIRRSTKSSVSTS